LPAQSADDLLSSLLGAAASLEPLKRTLIERTQGNPLFLEESVRTLVETKTLVGERGAYRLARDLRTIHVPATVQAILGARIDRLTPADKDLLQTAAVIGEEVPFTLLHAIAGCPEETLCMGLSRLQAAELLYEARLFPDLVYTFKHGLTRQVAYETLLEARRSVVHAKVVEVLERLYSGRALEHVELLANHAVRGEAWDKAVRYLHQAGNKAAGRSAYRQAVASFEQALRISQNMPETNVVREQAVDIRLDLRNALLALGEYKRILDCLREAEHLAETLADERRLGRVYSLMTVALVWNGEFERALEVGERGLAVAMRGNDPGLGMTTTLFLGLAHYCLGAYQTAVDLFDRNVKYLTGDLTYERFGLAALPAVQSRASLCLSLAELGRFSEGIRCGEEALRIGETVDHPFSVTIACQSLGSLYVIKGDVPAAVRVLERALKLCRTVQISQTIPPIAAGLGLAYLLSGRAAEGLTLLQEGVEQASSVSMVARQSFYTARLSEGYILSSRIHDALECAQRALNLARTYKERGTEGYLLRLLGEIASYQDCPDGDVASRYLREAMMLAEPRGMRPPVAHCHLGLGKLDGRNAEREQACEHLTTATAMYREMDMRFWLQKVAAQMQDLA
jgi:tetratricopeptide (TPR) repeat protein